MDTPHPRFVYSCNKLSAFLQILLYEKLVVSYIIHETCSMSSALMIEVAYVACGRHL